MEGFPPEPAARWSGPVWGEGKRRGWVGRNITGAGGVSDSDRAGATPWPAACWSGPVRGREKGAAWVPVTPTAHSRWQAARL